MNENPFNTNGARIPITVMNPNLKTKSLKDGMHYRLEVEIPREIWLAMSEANLDGHLAEIE